MIVSRDKLPAWVTPKYLFDDEIAVFWQRTDKSVDQFLFVVTNGEVTPSNGMCRHTKTGSSRINIPKSAPPEVLIAAGVEAMRRRKAGV